MASRRASPDRSESEPLHLALVGANHRTCPLDIRESLRRRITYSRIASSRESRELFDDLILLSTCNRMEAYAATSNPDAARSALNRMFGLEAGSGYTYELAGPDAAIHLFRVATGLDSVALGESQIADQLRRAAEQRPTRWDGPLADLFVRAARTAPRLRRLAGLDGRPASASHAAVRYVREVIRIPRARVTLLGSGKMGQLAAAALPGDTSITVVNRDYAKARRIAQQLAGRAVRLSEMPQALPQTDVLIAATSAKRRVLGARVLAQACASRDRLLWIIDLGVPRNVDPSAARIRGVRIVTVDDLSPWAGPPPDPAARARVDGAIRAEAEASLESLWPRNSDPVAALRRAAEHVRQLEVRSALTRIPGATRDEREILEKMSNRLVNQLLHAPTELARRLQAEGRDRLIENLLDDGDTSGGRR